MTTENVDAGNKTGENTAAGGAGGGNADGGNNTAAAKPWDSIQDEAVRGTVAAKGYADYASVATAYHHLTKLHRGAPDVIALPAADAPPEAWNEVYGRLGRPANADDYGTYGLPKEAQVDEDFAKTSRAWFHGAGLSTKQAATVVKGYQDYITNRIAAETEATKRANEAAVAEIKQRYGKNYEAAQARGQAAVKALGLSQKLLDDLEGQMGAPAVIDLLTTLGDKIGKEDIKVEGINKEGFGATKAELIAKRDAMQGTPDIVNALTSPQHPNHARYKREWDETIDKLSRM